MYNSVTKARIEVSVEDYQISDGHTLGSLLLLWVELPLPDTGIGTVECEYFKCILFIYILQLERIFKPFSPYI